MKLVILLSLCSVIYANSKPVLVRDNSTSQLFTSSLLTWETFNNDPNQLKHAVVGGTFIGEDVSYSINFHEMQGLQSFFHFKNRILKLIFAVRQSTRTPCPATSKSVS